MITRVKIKSLSKSFCVRELESETETDNNFRKKTKKNRMEKEDEKISYAFFHIYL